MSERPSAGDRTRGVRRAGLADRVEVGPARSPARLGSAVDDDRCTRPAPHAATCAAAWRGGLAWVGASQVMLQVIRMVGAIVVARLLTPDEYGLAMLALVFASLVLVFSDLALGAALVQRKELTEHDRSTAFWITVGSGVLFTVLGVALAGPGRRALRRSRRSRRCWPCCSRSASCSPRSARPSRRCCCARCSSAGSRCSTVAGALAGTVAAVVLARSGTGAWAIIGQQLVTAARRPALLLWRASPWRPRCAFSQGQRARPRRLLRLPASATGSSSTSTRTPTAS